MNKEPNPIEFLLQLFAAFAFGMVGATIVRWFLFGIINTPLGSVSYYLTACSISYLVCFIKYRWDNKRKIFE